MKEMEVRDERNINGTTNQMGANVQTKDIQRQSTKVIRPKESQRPKENLSHVYLELGHLVAHLLLSIVGVGEMQNQIFVFQTQFLHRFPLGRHLR